MATDTCARSVEKPSLFGKLCTQTLIGVVVGILLGTFQLKLATDLKS